MQEINLDKPPERSQFRLLGPLLLIAVLGMGSISGLFFYFTGVLQEAARDDRKDRVDIALLIESELLSAINFEYSYWDEAYEKLIMEPSLEFADDNIGDYLYEYQGISLSMVVNGEGQLNFAFLDGVLSNLDLAAISNAGLDELQRRESAAKIPDAGNVGFVSYDGYLYLLSLNSIVHEGPPELEDGSFLVLARRLEPSYLSALARKHKIQGLRFSTQAAGPTKTSLPLLDPLGKNQGSLVWTDPAQVVALDGWVGLLIAAIMIGICLLALYLVRRELRMQDAYKAMLSSLAYEDALTGISNRRAFFEQASRELVRSERSSSPAVLLMLDIDYFKSVNDEYGHTAGDTVLVALAQCLRDNLREYDLLARIGGEEFAILVTGVPLAEVLGSISRLQNAIKSLDQRVTSIPRAISVSIGVAEYRAGEELDALFERADLALYAAKTDGRDRYVIYDEAAHRAATPVA